MGKSSNMPAGLNESHISLAHGNGGRLMRELIEQVFAYHLSTDDALNTDADAVILPDLQGQLLTSVDGFAVFPLEFPGGNIGSLAVHGTVNDLAVAGSIPRYLTLSAFLEEGLEVALLERVLESFAKSANTAGVQVVAGDTKVVPRGHGGGIYFSVAGVGEADPGLNVSMAHIQAGDIILVSGSVGDHGAAVMLAREEFGLNGNVLSDCASVLPLTRNLSGVTGVKFLRDPTRGGLATVGHEIAQATALNVMLDQQSIPVAEPVSSICEILGYDPLYLACEGRCVAVVAPEIADDVLTRWQALNEGKGARIIGEVQDGQGHVLLQTPMGGVRRLEELEDDPLPRIC